MKPGEQLCLACALCCDGALFDHVQLGPADDAQKLKALGLPVLVSRSQPPAVRFRQRCAASCADRTCRVYADRPLQCRTFECGVFKDLEAGRIEFSAALRLVKRARARAENIRRLLRALGDANEHRSLSDRFSAVQRKMEAGGVDAAAGDAFAELTQAMHAFQLLAHDKFHTKVEPASASQVASMADDPQTTVRRVTGVPRR